MKGLIVFSLLLMTACTGKPVAVNSSSTVPTNKDGEYQAAGKITKIDNKIGSVELDHGDIPGLMPAMTMEFYVADKSMTSGFAVGENVDFTILYKDGTETITKMSPVR